MAPPFYLSKKGAPSGELNLIEAALRILSNVASECFHPDPREGLPGIFNILYSGEYTSKKCFSLAIRLFLSQGPLFFYKKKRGPSRIVKLKLQ